MKYLAPLIGVALGACISPWVENRKRKSELQHKFDILFLEISDLKKDSERMLAVAYQTHSKISLAEHCGLKNEYTKNYQIPRVIKFHAIDKLFLDVYPLLTYDQRNAIKSLTEVAGFINDKIDILSKSSDGDINNLDKSAARSVVNTLATLIYISSRMHHENERFKYFSELEDTDMMSKTLAAYGYSLELTKIIEKYETEEVAIQ